MGPGPAPLRILVLHNCDYEAQDPAAPGFESRADVENAARDIATALASRGHHVTTATVDEHSIAGLIAKVAASGCDLVFNLVESLRGDGRHELVVPALLDLAGVPYTGSGPLAVGSAVRKDRAKELLKAHGVPTPESFLVEKSRIDAAPLPFPLFVKPAREDASVGIDSASVCRDLPALQRAVERVLTELRQPALVERYIEGREVYVSILGNDPPRVLPLHEVDFSRMPDGLPRIVSYVGKWDESSPEFHGARPVRCLLDAETRTRVEEAAAAAFRALELTDYGRVDLRVDEHGAPWVIDVNPNCDLSAAEGLSRAASYAGLRYPELVERICLIALERHRHERTANAQRPAATNVVPLDTTHPHGGSDAARPADRARRAVHGGGGAGGARADRRRAR